MFNRNDKEMQMKTSLGMVLAAACVAFAASGTTPAEGNATPAVRAAKTIQGDKADFPRIGKLVPRTAPDPKDDQWMIGCELLDRDFTKFAAYKDYLPQLGIRSIRLQGG